MGKFDGYLICTDIDGTIEHGSDFESYAENYRAAKYFTENGGRFTFTTGRYRDYLEKERFYNVMNAPACVFNGGIIYDYARNKILFESRLPHTNRNIIEFCKPFEKHIKRFTFCHSRDSAYDCTGGEELPEEFLDINSIKVVCVFDDIETADRFRDTMRALPRLSDYYICKAWDVGVEFLRGNATKGQAVQFIKKYLGDIHTVIGIGDNENDLPMIEMADIGAAVGDATEHIKEKADIVVAPCSGFAIKDLINRIENGEI